MKIRVEHNGTVFECERQPMSEDRFRAVCKLAAAGLYVGLTLGAAALCGLPGLGVVGLVTFFGMLFAGASQI